MCVFARLPTNMLDITVSIQLMGSREEGSGSGAGGVAERRAQLVERLFFQDPFFLGLQFDTKNPGRRDCTLQSWERLA